MLRSGLFCLALLCIPACSEVILHPGYDYQAVKDKYQGPVLPVLTNYKASDLSVDEQAIETNLNNVIGRGLVAGDAIILTAAAGGDFPRLTLDQRKQVVNATMRAVKGRTPVIVSIQNSNVDEIVEMARFSEASGADAIQISCPYYYPASLEDFNRTMAFIMEATKKVDVLVYNTPWEYNPPSDSAMDFSLEDIEYLANTWPRFLLLKWATNGDMYKYQKVIHTMRSRLAIVDNVDIFPMSYLLGGTGFISHHANLWPEWNVELHRALKAGKYAWAQEQISKVYWPWTEYFTKVLKRTSAEGGPVKGALDLLQGRIGGPVAKPSRRINEEESKELFALLKATGVPGLKKELNDVLL